MIASFMLYALCVGVLCAAAAWLGDGALAMLGRQRRMAWLLGMFASVAIPLVSLLPAEPAIQASAAGSGGATPAGGAAAAPAYFVMNVLPEVPRFQALEILLGFAWVLLTLLVVGSYVAGALRLKHGARNWSSAQGTGGELWVSEDIGPAVYGFLRPRIVVPRWLMVSPRATQQLVLEHEWQHVAARDHLLVAMGLALVALFPWNPALLWQLRRLRFSLEVDCDARVLARGADPADYGETLLTVSQKSRCMPANSVALIERPTQLERRIHIMTRTTPRFAAWIAVASLALAATCVFAATTVKSPPVAPDAPLKPTPSGGDAMKLGMRFEKMLTDRYPGLLEQDRAGSAIVVVLLNEDWSVARSAVVNSDEKMENVQLTEGVFGVIGLAQGDVPYVGAMGMQSPTDPLHRLLIAYTERTTPGKRFVSSITPDTRAVDRELFQRYFPVAARDGVPAGQSPWILLDRTGHVLRRGVEAVNPRSWNQALEARFPGIRTEGITVTAVTNDAEEPVLDAAGKELQLHSVWLAPDSAPPAN